MFYIGLLKRIIPFFITFAAGLFIASLFVPLSFPRFRPGENRRHKHRECRQVKIEVEQLREDKVRLMLENDELRNAGLDSFDLDVTPPKFDSDITPPPPARSKMRIHTRESR